MLSFNKGEWSEVYTFFKLLCQNKIDVTNEYLIKKIDDYKLISIIKKIASLNQNTKFYNKQDFIEYLNKQTIKIPIDKFSNTKQVILENILKNTSKTGSFPIPSIDNFLKGLDVNFKGKAQDKSDLEAEIFDKNIKAQKTLNYSIKSQLGSPATLLNASKATNIEYKILNMPLSEISSINGIKTPTKLIDRYKKIVELGGKIQYERITNQTFNNNLTFIDGDLPKILGMLLFYSYQYGKKNFSDLLNCLTQNNPLNYTSQSINSQNIYKEKITRFLEAFAFGMVPASIWTSSNTLVDGGFLIVKKDGQIFLLDKIYHDETIKNYLINNVKLDSPSTTRYKMLELYQKNNEVFFTLNIQVRFIN